LNTYTHLGYEDAEEEMKRLAGETPGQKTVSSKKTVS